MKECNLCHEIKDESHFNQITDYENSDSDVERYVCLECIEELKRTGFVKKRYNKTNKVYKNPTVYKVLTSKQCNTCHEHKLVSEFHKNKRHLDGLESNCKVCCAHYNRLYRIANRAKVLAQKRLAYWLTPNRLEVRAKWREENREKIRGWDKSYHKKHRARKTRRDNKYRKNRRARDPIFKAFYNVRGTVNTYIRRNSIGGKQFHTYQYIDKSVFEKIGTKPFVGFALDHIIPLRVGNPQNVEDMKMLHLPVNLRWIPGDINGIKSDIIYWNLIEHNEELLKIADYFKITKDDDRKRAQDLFPIIDYVFVGRK